jgi:hypothetical protein
VEREIEVFESSERAIEELEVRMKKARKIIESGPIYDKRGQLLGKRAVTARLKATELAEILWTNDNKLYIVRSESLRHALAFEDQHYKHKRVATAPTN